MRCVAVILSGGAGSRMNMDIPKQYISVGDRMIITEAVRPFVECEFINAIRIVADISWRERILEEYPNEEKFHGFSSPGANRQLSIVNALRDLSGDFDDDDIVIIHDAARPLVSVDMVTRCIEGAREHDGVMPVLPMKDTVYYSEDGNSVTRLINRDNVYAGQAPEAFKIGVYLAACERLIPDKIMSIKGSSEPAIMAGLDVAMIPGDEKNFKITTKDDLERYIKIVKSGV